MRGLLTIERLVEDEEEAWNEDEGVDAMVNPVKICNFVAIFFGENISCDGIEQDSDHLSKRN